MLITGWAAPLIIIQINIVQIKPNKCGYRSGDRRKQQQVSWMLWLCGPRARSTRGAEGIKNSLFGKHAGWLSGLQHGKDAADWRDQSVCFTQHMHPTIYFPWSCAQGWSQPDFTLKRERGSAGAGCCGRAYGEFHNVDFRILNPTQQLYFKTILPYWENG